MTVLRSLAPFDWVYKLPYKNQTCAKHSPVQTQRLLALLACCLFAPFASGAVYKSIGPDGKVTYSDTPPASGSVDVSKEIRKRDPALKLDPVKAAMAIYAKEVIVETAYRFCREQVPQSETRVRIARQAWMDRHAQLRAKKIVVLHDKFSTNELRALAVKAEAENERLLSTLRQAPLEERTKWCANAPKTFTTPEFDLAANQDLVDTIMNYKVSSGGPEAR